MTHFENFYYQELERIDKAQGRIFEYFFNECKTRNIIPSCSVAIMYRRMADLDQDGKYITKYIEYCNLSGQKIELNNFYNLYFMLHDEQS